jgi:polysaccharide biosynthesis protein PslG
VHSTESTTRYKRGFKVLLMGCLLASITLLSGSAQAAVTTRPAGWIDSPLATDKLNASSVSVSGWALDSGATTVPGVDTVDLYLDNVFAGSAVYGDTRPDMGAAYGANFLRSGFHATLDLSKIGGGPHFLEARAHSVVSHVSTTYSRTFNVVKPLRFGANGHLMWYGLDAAIVDLDRIKAAGLTSVRFDYYWSTAEPNTKGVFDQSYLTKLDGVVAAARSRGLRVNITVVGTPGWARNNVGTIWTPPTNPSDYADHLDVLARRNASVPSMAYEIWNEPNQTQFWNAPGGPNAAAYTRLLQAAYPRIKAAAPTALVLGGSIAFNDQAFIKGMYATGARGFFDVLAVHPYSMAYGPTSTVSAYQSYTLALQQLQTTMAGYGEPNKPLWITESGWSTNDVSDATRAGYFQQAVSMLVNFPHVEEYQSYALNQAEDMPDMGLTSGSGVPTASWTAYVAAAQLAAAQRSG